MSLRMHPYHGRSCTSLVGRRRSLVDLQGLKGLSSTAESDTLEVGSTLELLGVAVVESISVLLLLQVVVMMTLRLRYRCFLCGCCQAEDLYAVAHQQHFHCHRRGFGNC